jgi:hypothetical protein
MFTARKKIVKEKGAEPDDFEETVAQVRGAGGCRGWAGSRQQQGGARAAPAPHVPLPPLLLPVWSAAALLPLLACAALMCISPLCHTATRPCLTWRPPTMS